MLHLNDMDQLSPFFVNLVLSLRELQKKNNNNIDELAKEIETKRQFFNSELSRLQLSDLHADTGIQVHESTPEPLMTETISSDQDGLNVEKIRMDIFKEVSYDRRSEIRYSGNIQPDIGGGYLFNSGIFKDNLNGSNKLGEPSNSSCTGFISSLQSYIIPLARGDFKYDHEYDNYQNSLKKEKFPGIKKITNAFTAWLKNYHEIYDSVHGPMPIDTIKDKYELSLKEQWSFMSTKSKQQRKKKLQEEKTMAETDSKKWLEFAALSLNLLESVQSAFPYCNNCKGLNPEGTFQIGELKKFLIKEIEQFTPESLQKLINHLNTNSDVSIDSQKLICGGSKDEKDKTLHNFTWHIEKKLSAAQDSISDLDTKSLKINPTNIKGSSPV